jgi:hypothetical protein
LIKLHFTNAYGNNHNYVERNQVESITLLNCADFSIDSVTRAYQIRSLGKPCIAFRQRWLSDD